MTILAIIIVLALAGLEWHEHKEFHKRRNRRIEQAQLEENLYQ